jgi:hypothetical protein
MDVQVVKEYIEIEMHGNVVAQYVTLIVIISKALAQ